MHQWRIVGILSTAPALIHTHILAILHWNPQQPSTSYWNGIISKLGIIVHTHLIDYCQVAWTGSFYGSANNLNLPWTYFPPILREYFWLNKINDLSLKTSLWILVNDYMLFHLNKNETDQRTLRERNHIEICRQWKETSFRKLTSKKHFLFWYIISRGPSVKPVTLVLLNVPIDFHCKPKQRKTTPREQPWRFIVAHVKLHSSQSDLAEICHFWGSPLKLLLRSHSCLTGTTNGVKTMALLCCFQFVLYCHVFSSPLPLLSCFYAPLPSRSLLR